MEDTFVEQREIAERIEKEERLERLSNEFKLGHEAEVRVVDLTLTAKTTLTTPMTPLHESQILWSMEDT